MVVARVDTADNSLQPIALVVLGMHRSGTSALTGVLSLLGCAMPQSLIPPNENNPKGYFESLKIYSLNDELLATKGSSWDDWRPLPARWYTTNDVAVLKAKAAATLTAEFGSNGLLALKDPRICRLLPFWRKVWKAAGLRVRFVCVHRNPYEVAASLAHREGWPEAVGQLLWLRHVLEAEVSSRGKTRTFVSYDMLMRDWRGTAESIARALKVQWPKSIEIAATEVERFLSADLRHFNSTRIERNIHDQLRGWVQIVWEILDRWAETSESKKDYKTLDRVKAAFDGAAPTFDLFAQMVDDLARRTADLNDQLAGSQVTASRLAADKSDLEQRLHQIESALHQRSHEADEVHQENQKQAKALEESSTAIRQLQDDNALLREQRSYADRQLRMMTHYAIRDMRLRLANKLYPAIPDDVAGLAMERNNSEEILTAFEKARDFATASLAERNELFTKISRLEEEQNTSRELQMERDTLMARIANLELTEAALRNSTSWRLTAPFRNVMKVFRRI